MTHYFLTINREDVPEDIRPHAWVLAVGVVLSLVAIILNPGGMEWTLGVMSISFGGLLLYLLSLRRLPDGALIARVGEPMPELAAVDHAGNPFDLGDLKGKRVLFKFFRGSW